MQNAECGMQSGLLEAREQDGRALRVEFLWRGDRFGHVISAVRPDGAVVPLLESVEGTTAEDWPASPPLQSLSVVILEDGRRAALLVGMAGRSHWSASLEPEADRAELRFDLACRTNGEQGWLGNRYRVIEDAFCISAESPALVRRADSGEIQVQPVAESWSAATARWRFTVCLTAEY